MTQRIPPQFEQAEQRPESQGQDPLGWIRKVAENGASRLKEAERQGYLKSRDVPSLVGKMQAHRISVVEAINSVTLTGEGRDRLIGSLLDHYQRLVDATIQEAYAGAHSGRKQ